MELKLVDENDNGIAEKKKKATRKWTDSNINDKNWAMTRKVKSSCVAQW